MTDERKFEAGDIVQLGGEDVGNPMFRHCMLTVTDVRQWGVMGYVQALGEGGKEGGHAFYKAGWDEFEATGGRAVWVRP